VDGATGCGKTRFGLELFKALHSEFPGYGMHYAYIEFKQTLSDYSSAEPAKQENINLAEQELLTNLQPAGQSFSLDYILNHLDPTPTKEPMTNMRISTKNLTEDKKTSVLVLHIDEYQYRPQAAAAMLRVVRDKNSNRPQNRPTPYMVVVLTGLSRTQLELELGLDEPAQAASAGASRLAITGGVPLEVTLHYSGADVLQLLHNAAKAVRRIYSPPFFGSAPVHYQRLLEDTMGWPVAVINLGAALAYVNFSPSTKSEAVTDDDILAALKTVELTYLTYVRKSYKPRIAARLQSFKVEKLLRVAMSPYSVSVQGTVTRMKQHFLSIQVSKQERFNGPESNIETLKSTGLADIQEAPLNRVFVRMPKSLLLLLNEKAKLVNQALLRTTRKTWGDVQEMVQLFSLVNAYQTLNMLEAKEDKEARITLQRLRPGATLYGGDVEIPRDLPMNIRTTFTAEGFLDPATRYWWHEVKHPDGVCGLVPAGTNAIDGWMKYQGLDGVYALQSKGMVIERLNELKHPYKAPKAVADLFSAMAKQADKSPTTSALAFEVMTAARVPGQDKVYLDGGNGNPDHAIKTDKPCILVSAESLKQAVGSIFAGAMAWAMEDTERSGQASGEFIGVGSVGGFGVGVGVSTGTAAAAAAAGGGGGGGGGNYDLRMEEEEDASHESTKSGKRSGKHKQDHVDDGTPSQKKGGTQSQQRGGSRRRRKGK